MSSESIESLPYALSASISSRPTAALRGSLGTDFLVLVGVAFASFTADDCLGRGLAADRFFALEGMLVLGLFLTVSDVS